VQDESNPLDNCYWAQLDTSSGANIDLLERVDGSTYTLQGGQPFNKTEDPSKPYRIAGRVTSSGIQALVYDTDGETILGKTDVISSSSHRGGTVGTYTGSDAGQRYDYFTRRRI
jgi:hypothetical protein